MISLIYFAFWYELFNFRIRVFVSMLKFKLFNFFLRVCDHNKSAMLCNGPVLLIYNILKIEIPWKSWSDPWFPRNSKSKWTLKWLPLDRGHFKFYFWKGKSILIILGRTYIWTFNFVILFQVVSILSCILSLLNASHFDIIDRQSLENEVA